MSTTDFFKQLEVNRLENKMTDFYDKYAEQYDNIMAVTHYEGIQKCIAAMLRERIKGDDCLILDIGCGTGLSGVWLENAGFAALHGTDPSIESLSVAKGKQVYSNVFYGKITETEKLTCADNTYDGVACIGCISRNQIHIQPALAEFCRIIKPGGYAAFTITDSRLPPSEFMPRLGELMSEKVIELLLLERKAYYSEEICYCCVIKIL